MPVAVGDRVKVAGYESLGVAKYVGPHKQGKKGNRVGVALDEPEGRNNGTVGGDKYFECAEGHGALVLEKKVEVVMPAAEWAKAQKKSGRKSSKKDAKKAADPAKATKEAEAKHAKEEARLAKEEAKRAMEEAKRASKREKSSKRVKSPAKAEAPKTTKTAKAAASPPPPADPEPTAAAAPPERQELPPAEQQQRQPEPAGSGSGNDDSNGDDAGGEQMLTSGADADADGDADADAAAGDDSAAGTGADATEPAADAPKPALGRWEQMQAARAAKEEQKRLEEERRAEEEASKRTDAKSKRAAFLSRWQPVKDGPTQLSDAEIAARKEARKGSKHNVFARKTVATADVAATDASAAAKDDVVLSSYVEKSAEMKTLQRKVGRGKKMAEQRKEEQDAAQSEIDSRDHVTTGTYVEVALFVFPNAASARPFESLVKEMVDDDRQAEGLFAVYRLGAAEGAAPKGADGSKHRHLPSISDPRTAPADGPTAEVSFVAVSVGTCQQLVELYQLFDVAKTIKASLDESAMLMAARKGVKAHEAALFSTSVPAAVQAIAGRWDGLRKSRYATVSDPAVAVAGGWRAVAKFRKSHDDDWVVLAAFMRFSSMAAASAYRAGAPKRDPSEEAIRWSVASPDGTTVTTFAVATARGLGAGGFFTADPPQGCASTTVYLVGPGIHYPGTDALVAHAASWPGAAVFAADQFADVAGSPM